MLSLQERGEELHPEILRDTIRCKSFETRLFSLLFRHSLRCTLVLPHGDTSPSLIPERISLIYVSD